METDSVAQIPTIAQVSPNGTRSALTVGASPYIYINSGNNLQILLVSGGTVTSIEISADAGTTYDVVGLLGGSYVLRPADRARITYAVVPTCRILGA